ncbi:WD repeat-containing protein 86 [Fukomys damarensis]|nr:WD repeat-containing protein 86 [Fukomys damarensis]
MGTRRPRSGRAAAGGEGGIPSRTSGAQGRERPSPNLKTPLSAPTYLLSTLGPGGRGRKRRSPSTWRCRSEEGRERKARTPARLGGWELGVELAPSRTPRAHLRQTRDPSNPARRPLTRIQLCPSRNPGERPTPVSLCAQGAAEGGGHESYVTFCQLEDGAAFTCSADCTIRRWDVHTGQCAQVYRGHTSIVNRILVANNQLFSSSYDRTARVWTVDKGQVSREFRGHRNCVLTLAYSAPWDTSCAEEAEARGLLVTGSTDGTAKVWQVASGCCRQTLRGHTGAVLCLVLDGPGRTAFTGSTDATIRAWDILSGEQLRVFREHQGSIICLELTEQLLYSGSADRTVKCWLADTGQRVRTFPAHRRSVSALKFHAGTLFTGSGDACARAFDAQSGALQRVFRGHTLVINCLQVHGHVLYTASHDGALRLWDLRGLQAPCHRSSGKRSLSRLFSNRVACVTAAPLQPT